MTNNNNTLEGLFERFENDMIYDCHQLGTRIERSEAKRLMEFRGRYVLGAIGAHLFSRFPNGEFNEVGEGYWELFVAWIRVLYCIASEWRILSDCPYSTKVPYCEQNMDKWIAFCFRMAQ